ncbi:interleukin-1 receptor-associated kinase 1-binding protein 1 [Aplysia californica]|uniref:Interleukin-1 receptor-associated kinase 1-binding protein 1 n=1 Tax=Aplysia californica TaxID=6500 RepID=A0ABM0JN99_APLCA|nr:interleukin-1 receptor-associated kinase 1-binding protein 1 [Aplysia californica]
MAYTRPVRVFTDIKTPQKPKREFVVASENMLNSAQNIKENVTLTALDRQITVTGVGELELRPDRFSATIKCKASKDNIQEAKTSVTRRLDYIIQTLKNVSLKEEDYKVYQHVNYQDSVAVYECEVEAHFTDIGKCLGVSNLLVEKLGPGVSVTLPLCYHASGSLDKLRKQAGMLAIHNARQKAMEMTKVIHMSVGPAVQVEEHGFSETQGLPSSDLDDLDLTPGIQQRVGEKTVKISSKVSVCFQLRPSKKKLGYPS